MLFQQLTVTESWQAPLDCQKSGWEAKCNEETDATIENGRWSSIIVCNKSDKEKKEANQSS